MTKQQNSNTIWAIDLYPKYETIYNETNNKWVEHLLVNIYTDAHKNYENTKNDYKKNHKHFFYYFFCCIVLPLSCLLIIPAYWAFKKFKELKTNKNNLIQKIEEAKKEKIKAHYDIVSQMNILEIIDSFKGIINYQHKGPIPLKLIEEMQSLSLFDFNLYDDTVNPYSTSWGIFDDKIVIHGSKQKHHSYMKTYTGSKTVTYSYTNSKGERITSSTIVSASYNHPAHSIFDERHTFAFMESCSNLEFSFEGKKSIFSKSHNKKNNYSPLENSEFEKKFKWNRTDDVQFRMIFTPYTQEKFLDELGKQKDIPPELDWEKTASFIYNDYPTTQFSYMIERNINKTISDFLNDADKDLEILKKSIFESIIFYYHNLYKNMNYMFLTTIMSSENHKTIINAINKSDNWISDTNNYFFAHNILSEFLDHNIILKNTNCFNSMIDSKVSNISNTNVYHSKMNGLSYEIIPKIIYIPTYCPEAGYSVDVPVNYDDYIPYTDEGYITYFYVPSELYYYHIPYFGIKTNIQDQDLLNELNNLGAEKIVYKNNTFAFYTKEPFNKNNILESIIKKIKTKNNS